MISPLRSRVSTPFAAALAPFFAVLMMLPAVSTAEPQLSVAGFELASQRRLGPTVFEYAYRIQVRNTGTAAEDVEITLRGTPTGVRAVTRQTTLAQLGAGALGTSVSRVVVHHDRRHPFRFDQLIWSLRARDASFGGLLSGASDSPALSSTRNYNARPRASRLVADAAGRSFDVAGLSVRMATEATVGQINTALAAVNGRIVGMGRGDRVLDIAIPDAGSLAGLNAVLARLGTAPGVAMVWASTPAQPAALPRNPAYLAPTGPAFYQGTPAAQARSNFLAALLAIRAPATWNLAGMLETPELASRRPVMMYMDLFNKDGPPGLQRTPDLDWQRIQGGLWNAVVAASDFALPGALVNPDSHGYEVMSTVSASFGGDDSNEGLVTGLFPADLESRVVNLLRYNTEAAYRELVDLIATYTVDSALPANVIVSTSLGTCTQNAPCSTDARLRAAFLASRLVESVRARLLDQDGQPTFLHLYAVGNVVGNAATNPPKWAYEEMFGAGDDSVLVAPAAQDAAVPLMHPAGKLASLVVKRSNPPFDWLLIGLNNVAPELVGGQQVLLTKLPNMLAVESRGNTRSQSFAFPGDPALNVPPSTRQIPPIPGCPTAYSNKRGTIAGLGGNDIDDLWLLTGANGPAGTAAGTSFASPQVAAAAAWVWSLAPQLKVAEVRRLLIASTRSAGIPCGPGELEYASSVDVYAAALATDNPYPSADIRHRNLGNTGLAPARKWLLDVASVTADGRLVDTPDGKFTQADIMKFLREFEKRRGDQTPDYSRHDLNGNGVTGEPAARQDLTYAARFDLDGDLTWTYADKTIEGVMQRFREDLTTDLEVLVYYAYSPLYEGNEYERTMLLLPYLRSLPSPASVFLSRLAISVPAPNLRVGSFDLSIVDQLGSSFTSLCPATGGERGAPLFSAVAAAEGASRQADANVFFWRPNSQVGRIQEKPANATNCSSFFASLPAHGLLWANSAARNNDTNTGADEEYQSRFFFGEPDLAAGPAGQFTPTPRRLATQTMTYGIVPAPGAAFASLFTTRVFKLAAPTFVGP